MNEPARERRDIRFLAGLIAGTGLVVVSEGLALLPSRGPGILPLPSAHLVLDAGCAAVVLTGNRMLRPGVLVITVLGAVLQMVLVLSNGPLWSTVVSVLLAIAQVYTLVLLNTKPVRVHFGLDTHDDPLDLER